jgi:hypothetical protein
MPPWRRRRVTPRGRVRMRACTVGEGERGGGGGEGRACAGGVGGGGGARAGGGAGAWCGSFGKSRTCEKSGRAALGRRPGDSRRAPRGDTAPCTDRGRKAPVPAPVGVGRGESQGAGSGAPSCGSRGGAGGRPPSAAPPREARGERGERLRGGANRSVRKEVGRGRKGHKSAPEVSQVCAGSVTSLRRYRDRRRAPGGPPEGVQGGTAGRCCRRCRRAARRRGARRPRARRRPPGGRGRAAALRRARATRAACPGATWR